MGAIENVGLVMGDSRAIAPSPKIQKSVRSHRLIVLSAIENVGLAMGNSRAIAPTLKAKKACVRSGFGGIYVPLSLMRPVPLGAFGIAPNYLN